MADSAYVTAKDQHRFKGNRRVTVTDIHPRVLGIVPRTAHPEAHQDRKDVGFVDGDPILDAIPEPLEEYVCEEGKLGANPLVKPAPVVLLSFQGRVPMEDGDPRRNAPGHKRVDETIVVREAGLIDSPIAFDDSSPRDRKAVSVDAILGQQVDVLL